MTIRGIRLGFGDPPLTLQAATGRYGVIAPQSTTLGSTGSSGFSLSVAAGSYGLTGQSVTIIGPGVPAMPTNVQLIQQGGPSNNLTNSQKISWDLVAGATSYNVYRNGVFRSNVLAPSVTFTDTTATNSNFVGNEPTVTGPGTVYGYTVSAVNGSGEGPQSNDLICWEYFHGTNFESGQFPFAYGIANADYSYANGSPPGGGNCIAITWNSGQGGGLQIVGGSGLSPTFDLELGAFNYLNFYLSTPNLSNQIKIAAHSRVPGGSFGPGDVFSFHEYLITQFIVSGPQVVNTWQQYKIPFKKLGLGVTSFTGYIAGTTLTVVSVNGGVGTLGVDYAGIDNGGWISGPGVTTTYVNGLGAPNPPVLGDPGKYTVAVSQTVGSAGSPITMTCARVNKYKQDLHMNDGNPGGVVLYTNIGYSVL